MTTVADCFRQHAPAYLEKFGDRVPGGHRKVLRAITACRTGQLGSVLFDCHDCGRSHWVGRSCGNRHCTTCQVDKTQKWLAKQTKRLMPVHHFMVTFTVPQPLRQLLRDHQRKGYTALFQASRDTISCLLANPKYLGSSRAGFLGVLHTWGRDPMVYHPHVHFIVPGGGVNDAGTEWISTPENFLFPHAAAIRIYKAKFADALRTTDLYKDTPVEAWNGKWVIDIKPVNNGRAALKYLAPYVHRVAISDHRIVSCDEKTVTYRYTPSGKKRAKQRTVEGTEFVRGFVQHTLPPRFQKVRYSGWMSSNSKFGFDLVKWLVWIFLGWRYWLGSGHAPQAPTPPRVVRCSHCGGELHVVAITFIDRNVFSEHALNYLDSG